MMKQLFFILIPTLFINCSNSKAKQENPSQTLDIQFEKKMEAREDSIELAATYRLMDKIKPAVTPDVETAPVGAEKMDDAADDPAIWYNSKAPDSSLIFGSNKKGGIYAYDLQGSETVFYELGDINNIDIRKDVIFGNKKVDILGASNRTDNSIILYQINEDGTLSNLLKTNFTIDTTDVDEVYGFCLHRNKKGDGYAIVNGKNGRINAYKITAKNDLAQLTLKYTWKLKTQPEGMVVDDQNEVLFAGEEERGIWKMDFSDGSKPILIADSQNENNPLIEYDIEGLAIYYGQSGDANDGFLLASIQGNFSYAIFERTGDNKYVTSFKIIKTDSIDGVEETDGLEIFSAPIGATFPNGVLIVQDGFNYDIETLKSQNFKIVDLKKVLSLIEGSLK